MTMMIMFHEERNRTEPERQGRMQNVENESAGGFLRRDEGSGFIVRLSAGLMSHDRKGGWGWVEMWNESTATTMGRCDDVQLARVMPRSVMECMEEAIAAAAVVVVAWRRTIRMGQVLRVQTGRSRTERKEGMEGVGETEVTG